MNRLSVAYDARHGFIASAGKTISLFSQTSRRREEEGDPCARARFNEPSADKRVSVQRLIGVYLNERRINPRGRRARRRFDRRLAADGIFDAMTGKYDANRPRREIFHPRVVDAEFRSSRDSHSVSEVVG